VRDRKKIDTRFVQKRQMEEGEGVEKGEILRVMEGGR
jgi:hypothetical protein